MIKSVNKKVMKEEIKLIEDLVPTDYLLRKLKMY